MPKLQYLQNACYKKDPHGNFCGGCFARTKKEYCHTPEDFVHYASAIIIEPAVAGTGIPLTQ
jgi:hypothetical protein